MKKLIHDSVVQDEAILQVHLLLLVQTKLISRDRWMHHVKALAKSGMQNTAEAVYRATEK